MKPNGVNDVKKAITILAVCSLMLTACGQTDDTESKVETTTVIASESTSDTETSPAKEEKDTSEATTTTKKSSQTVSSASKPTGTAVTTTKKSISSGTSGNSREGQNNSVRNNNGQENSDQSVRNSQQPDNSPSDNHQSNNGAEQNNRPTNNKPQTTTAPQTEPPSPKPTEEERYMDIGRSLSHNGSDYSKAEAVYNWMTENGSGTCVNYSWQTYYLCKGTGLECYLVWTPSKLYGHVANVVKVNGAWFVLDTQGQGFLLNNDCGFSEIIDIDESYISGADLISSQRYDDIY
ncbi:hypothetical protein [Ruminococcus sp. Marseille-P6503]|uniref:hypothetical protein n=1 Tax=Ruminococcus sp. Marseille-P6503 TaxID=2364796 RepID=UPI0019D150CC|nr:hypothetical protein [Ruminococcus sp. Marseille-P6503]